MRNLFLMHTQYNILSALTIANQEYASDENDLAISAEFNVTEEYLYLLKNEFRNVWILQSKFDSTGASHRAGVFADKYKKAKEMLKVKYDRIITAQEQYFDTLLVTKLHQRNPQLVWQSVEEDAYYSITSGRVLRSSLIRRAAKWFYYAAFLPAAYGENAYYEKIPCYGANRGIQTLFLTFPVEAREELNSKEKKEVLSEYLVYAVQKLYAQNQEECILQEKSVVFFSDLISRYVDSEMIYQAVQTLFDKYRRLGYHPYIKYHPRETQPWPFGQDVAILPSHLPAELILAQNKGRQLISVGNTSTAIILSRKFGYKTYSLVRKSSQMLNENAIAFFEKIGIECV